MNNDSRFSNGFLLGLILGGGAVFLLGTRTGKNLLKIMSEQGLEGLTDLLEEYGLGNLEEVEEVEEAQEEIKNGELKKPHSGQEEVLQEKPVVKKRFFRKIRR